MPTELAAPATSLQGSKKQLQSSDHSSTAKVLLISANFVKIGPADGEIIGLTKITEIFLNKKQQQNTTLLACASRRAGGLIHRVTVT